MWQRFVIALQLLTRIPISLKGEITPKDLARSVAVFPLIGGLIGILLSGVYILAAKVYSTNVVVALVLTVMVLITGGLHVDGLMDTADGIGSGRSRERMLEIMRDSRVGSMGVIAFGLVYLLKFMLLGDMPVDLIIVSLAGIPVLSRWAMVIAIYLYPYARSGSGIGKPYAEHVGWQELAVATLIALAIVWGLWHWSGLLAAALTGGVAVLLSFYLYTRLGGLTGDCYGAINEVTEVAVLMILIAQARLG